MHLAVSYCPSEHVMSGKHARLVLALLLRTGVWPQGVGSGVGCTVASAIRIRGLHLGGRIAEDDTSPQETNHGQPYQSLEPTRRQKLTSGLLSGETPSGFAKREGLGAGWRPGAP